MEYSEFLKQVLPPLGYAWRPHRRRAVKRKIKRRMETFHLFSFEDYLNRLKESPEEIEIFKNLLPISVSRFFRNHEYFEFLRDEIFPEILKRGLKTIRIWSLGAAAGEEAYSIAMVWDYWFAKKYPDHRILIEASDIDETIMERGKKAIYEKSSLRELPKELINRYFEITDTGCVLDSSIREYVTWHRLDIRGDPPLPDNDIIFCCYLVFTYFSNPIQNEIAKKLANAISSGGYLILGRKDNEPKILWDHFQKVSSCLKIFKIRRGTNES